jgi:transcriptional regulator with XRE-family HTH domain
MITKAHRKKTKASILMAIAIAGGSQKLLAEKTGLTQGAISKYLKFKSMPTGQTAKRLCEISDKFTPADFAPHIFDDE